MLGRQIGEEIGQLTGMRVLAPQSGSPVVEASFQANGTMLDMQVTDMGTYRSQLRPDGTLMGSGHGIIMTEDGGSATWTGHGIGHFTGRGQGVRWRGALYYETNDERLKEMAANPVVFEYETDETGKTEAKIWEWK